MKKTTNKKPPAPRYMQLSKVAIAVKTSLYTPDGRLKAFLKEGV